MLPGTEAHTCRENLIGRFGGDEFLNAVKDTPDGGSIRTALVTREISGILDSGSTEE